MAKTNTTTINFTATRVADFQPRNGKTQDFQWDATAPGLGQCVSKTSSAYVFQYRLDGKPKRLTIGKTSIWRLSDVRDEARRLRVIVDSGKDPRKVKADAIAKEKAEQSAKSELDAIAYAKQSLIARTVWDAYVAARFPMWGEAHRSDHFNAAKAGGDPCKIGNRNSKSGPLAALLSKPIHEITDAVVREWLLHERETRSTTALNSYRKFCTFILWCSTHPEYKHAVHADCCLTRTVKDIVPKKKTKEGDSLQREQLTLWFGAVKKISNPIISAYLQCLLLTGARRNELTTLAWKDINFQLGSSLTIRDKVEGERTIPLTPYLSSLLDALPRYNKWVFSSPTSASGHIESPTKAHAQAVTAIGLPHVSLHGLRRSFGTLAEWVEVPTGVVAQIMGHKPSAVAEKHYIRRSIDMLRMWHVRIENWILEQAK